MKRKIDRNSKAQLTRDITFINRLKKGRISWWTEKDVFDALEDWRQELIKLRKEKQEVKE
jgi:hypothetical protein